MARASGSLVQLVMPRSCAVLIPDPPGCLYFKGVLTLGELAHSEGLVRAYVAWALGRIGGGRARQVLEASQARETDEFAKKEIQAALAVA